MEEETAQHVGTVTPEEDARRALCLRQEPWGCPPAWELRLFGSKCERSFFTDTHTLIPRR